MIVLLVDAETKTDFTLWTLTNEQVKCYLSADLGSVFKKLKHFARTFKNHPLQTPHKNIQAQYSSHSIGLKRQELILGPDSTEVVAPVPLGNNEGGLAFTPIKPMAFVSVLVKEVEPQCISPGKQVRFLHLRVPVKEAWPLHLSVTVIKEQLLCLK